MDEAGAGAAGADGGAEGPCAGYPEELDEAGGAFDADVDEEDRDTGSGQSSSGLSSSPLSASSNASGGTSPTAWVNACRLRSQFLRNTFPQDVHSYGLWSVCVRRWVFRLLRWLKLLAQTGHLCGDSSMCRILWTARVRLWQKPLPHSAHLKGFSLLWMYLRTSKEEDYSP